MAKQNRFAESIVCGVGTAASIAASYPMAIGEIAYASDTKQFYVAESTSLGGFKILVKVVAFAGLPAVPIEGMQYTVTDSNTNTWGATIAGGGANRVLAYYNGTNWTVAGV